MTQIEKYIERLKTLQNLYEEGQPQHNAFGIAIVEANEMLVKNCSIPDVVERSEQLRTCKYCGSDDIVIHQLTGFQSACNSCGA